MIDYLARKGRIKEQRALGLNGADWAEFEGSEEWLVRHSYGVDKVISSK